MVLGGLTPGETIVTAPQIPLKFWFLSFFTWTEAVWTHTGNSVSLP